MIDIRGPNLKQVIYIKSEIKVKLGNNRNGK